MKCGGGGELEMLLWIREFNSILSLKTSNFIENIHLKFPILHFILKPLFSTVKKVNVNLNQNKISHIFNFFLVLPQIIKEVRSYLYEL